MKQIKIEIMPHGLLTHLLVITLNGKAIMICVPRDERNFDDIEKLIQKEIPRIENPLGTVKSENKNGPKDAAEDTPKAKRAPRTSRSTKTGSAPVEAVEQPLDTKAEQPKPALARNRSSSSRGRSSNRDERTGNRVVGLGDHTPSFIELSFDERRTG